MVNKYKATDQEVVNQLMDNVIHNEVVISDNGNYLVVNTTFKSGFRTTSLCSSVKGYLRRNGFDTSCGVFTRKKIGEIYNIDLKRLKVFGSGTHGFPSGYWDKKENSELSEEDVAYFSKWLTLD